MKKIFTLILIFIFSNFIAIKLNSFNLTEQNITKKYIGVTYKFSDEDDYKYFQNYIKNNNNDFTIFHTLRFDDGETIAVVHFKKLFSKNEIIKKLDDTQIPLANYPTILGCWPTKDQFLDIDEC